MKSPLAFIFVLLAINAFGQKANQSSDDTWYGTHHTSDSLAYNRHVADSIGNMITFIKKIQPCKEHFWEEALEYNEQRAFEKMIADSLKKMPPLPDSCNLTYYIRVDVNCKGEIGNWRGAFEMFDRSIRTPRFYADFMNNLIITLKPVIYFKSNVDESLGDHFIRVSVDKGKVSLVY